MRSDTLAVTVAAMLFASPAFAAQAPQLHAKTLYDLGANLPYPYDASQNAHRAIAAATARAAASGKLLLLDLGGNWCGDCRILAGVMEQPEMKPFMAAHYVVVSIDVGRMDKNQDIPKRYGITQRLEALPAVLVIDPKTGKLLDKGHVEAMIDARHVSPQGIADWLAQWVK